MLPADDPYVKAYARRERFVPGLYLNRMITRFGESVSTVLVDGAVTGTWHIDREVDRDVVDVEMFTPEAAENRKAIETAATVVGKFFTGEEIPVTVSVYKK
jgi:hypothetical protein